MKLFEPYVDDLTIPRKLALGTQHLFTMFGATILVPILTGFNVSVALFAAGLCTLFFHVMTRGKLPIYLGSSFAFIAPVAAVVATYGVEYAQGGLIFAALMYLLVALLITIFGVEKIMSFFPPIVTGPIIIVIGLKLAPTAISMASSNWLLAFLSFAITVGVIIFTKGFIKLIPVICGLFGGYIIAAIAGFIDFSPIKDAAWFGIPAFTLPKFDLGVILMIAPVAIVTVIEHIGDMVTISSVTGRNALKDPGLNRTLVSDGLATSIAALFGGPANTTYSENTGVLVLTRQFNPVVMRIAACLAIVLSIFPKLGAFIGTIPGAVIGGISIVLFGMIASIGARNLVVNNIDFMKSRNLIVAAVILVLGLGGTEIPVVAGSVDFTLTSMAVAAIIGVIINKILPDKE